MDKNPTVLIINNQEIPWLLDRSRKALTRRNPRPNSHLDTYYPQLATHLSKILVQTHFSDLFWLAVHFLQLTIHTELYV